MEYYKAMTNNEENFLWASLDGSHQNIIQWEKERVGIEYFVYVKNWNKYMHISFIHRKKLQVFIIFKNSRSFLVAQWIKDPVLSLLWLRLLLGVGSIPGHETSACHRCGQKTKPTPTPQKNSRIIDSCSIVVHWAIRQVRETYSYLHLIYYY